MLKPEQNIKHPWLIIALSWVVFATLMMSIYPINNADQLHYLGVAWEMHNNHNYLMTFAGGHIDLQKPPFLYWLINGGWHVFGATITWPLILMYSISLASMLLTYWLADQIFPDKPAVKIVSAVILASCFYWPLFAGRIRFDSLIGLWSLLSINAYIYALKESKVWPLCLAGLSVGLGILTKGPVIFVFTLPFFLVAPWLVTSRLQLNRYYIISLLSVIVGTLIPGIWFWMVFHQYGHEISQYLAVKQVSSRMKIDFHPKAITHILSNFLPWTVLPALWLNIARIKKIPSKRSLLFVIATAVCIAFFMCLVRRITTRYLFPVYPQVAIILAVLITNYRYPKLEHFQRYVLSILLFLIGTLLTFLPHLNIPALAAVANYQNISPIWGLLLVASGGVIACCARQKEQPISFPWLMAFGFFMITLVVNVGVRSAMTSNYMQAFAERVKEAQQQGITVVNYRTQSMQSLEFYGKFKAPLQYVSSQARLDSIYKKDPTAWFWGQIRKSNPCIAPYTMLTNKRTRINVLAPISLYYNCHLASVSH